MTAILQMIFLNYSCVKIADLFIKIALKFDPNGVNI